MCTEVMGYGGCPGPGDWCGLLAQSCREGVSQEHGETSLRPVCLSRPILLLGRQCLCNATFQKSLLPTTVPPWCGQLSPVFQQRREAGKSVPGFRREVIWRTEGGGMVTVL